MRSALHLVRLDYQGQPVSYRDDGWFNATEAAARFGKEPFAWLNQRETLRYMAAICKRNGNSSFVQELNEIMDLPSSSPRSRRLLLGVAKKTGLVQAKAGSPETGGGTWLHPKLAVAFARWLDDDFAVWCDEQIDKIITGRHNWVEQRHAAAAGAKLLALTLKTVRESQGKETQSHHYSNEHLMINSAITGERKACDRNNATAAMLDALAKVQIQNAMLIVKEVPYPERQAAIQIAVQAMPTYPQLPASAKMIPVKQARRMRQKPAANDPGA